MREVCGGGKKSVVGERSLWSDSHEMVMQFIVTQVPMPDCNFKLCICMWVGGGVSFQFLAESTGMDLSRHITRG